MPEKKHTQKVLLIPMFLLAIYLGYCIGSLYGTDHTFKTAADQLRSIALHPFPLQLTPMTGKSILICMAAALVGVFRTTSLPDATICPAGNMVRRGWQSPKS